MSQHNASNAFGEAGKGRTPSWKYLAESGYVQQKYLKYSPEDITKINNIKTLENIKNLYSPLSERLNFFEMCYFQLIHAAVDDHLSLL